MAQGLRIETPSQTQVHGFGGRDVGDGEEVIVCQFPREACALAAQVEDFAAHERQDGRDPLHEPSASGAGAEHEGQGGGAGADDAAGHGGVDEAALGGAVDGVGDFAGGGGVDGRAVYEEAFGGGGGGWERWERRVEDVVEYVFDVGGLGEDGDYDFLRGLVSGWQCGFRFLRREGGIEDVRGLALMWNSNQGKGCVMRATNLDH